MCFLEIWFRAGFFDIMPHLMLHLVDELEICGPVHSRWCYSIERYLGVLVKYVRDKSRPEAGMASGSAVDEALGFCTEYFSLFNHTKRRVWDPEEELRDSGELLLGKGRFKRLTEFERDQIHEYILKNSLYTQDLLREWEDRCNAFKRDREVFRDTARARWRREGHPGPFRYTYPDALYYSFPTFAVWLNSHVRSLKADSFPIDCALEAVHCPPATHALSYDFMWAYGCHYRCCTNESGPSHVTYDCGIAAITPESVTTSLDVGVLKSIILVSYGTLKCVVMEGQWIPPTIDNRRAVKRDPFGFWIVQFHARDGPEKNPYVFPLGISQVFFMPYSEDPNWRVVLRHDPRSKRVVGDEELSHFGAMESSANLSRHGAMTESVSTQTTTNDEPEVESIPYQDVAALDAETLVTEDDAHLDDDQYVDEFVVEFVE